MAIPQLKLVQDAPPGFNPATADDTRRVFEHWLFMFGRSPRRCKLGPTRRTAINTALAIGYDVDTLLLAIEGMAADPLADASADRIRDAMREIEWLLGREARIERWAERGEALRASVQRQHAQADAEPAPVVAVDEAAEAHFRELCRQRAAARRCSAHG